MQSGRRVRVQAGSGLPASDPNSTLFTATLAQNAGLNGRIKLPEAIAAGRVAQCIIKDIQIVSVDLNIWELWFWGNSGFQSGHPNQDAFRGSYLFAAAGLQIGGAGLGYAHATALDLFYEDDEAGLAANVAAGVGAYLNVTLINRSAGAKTANGWFGLTVVCEPTQGQ